MGTNDRTREHPTCTTRHCDRAIQSTIVAGVGALCMAMPMAASSGVKIDGPGDSFLALSSRLQARYDSVDSEFVTGQAEDEFGIQRARLQMAFHINPWAMAFMQTELGSSAVGDGDGAGADFRLMSAWFLLKPKPQAQFLVGQHITGGSGRNGFASSGTYLAGDLYNVAFKGMNIGTRAAGGIFSTFIPNTDAGLRITEVPRDRGVTWFGHTTGSEDVHFKWYASLNDGAISAQGRDDDEFRYMVRGQLNLGDPENNIFPKGTWLGKKQTWAIGASYDTQSDVAFDTATGDSVDYTFWTVDTFLEQPLGNGTVNAEAAWMDLDLDDAQGMLSATAGGPALGAANATGRQAQGNGGYVSVGYLFNQKAGPGRIQPVAAFETWDSDDPNDVGSFDSYRVGVNYYLQGYDLVLKAFAAQDDLDWMAGAAPNIDDEITSFMVGVYTDY